MATLTATGVNCSNGTLDGYYTGSTSTNTSYPIGSYLLCDEQTNSSTYPLNLSLGYYQVQNSGSPGLPYHWQTPAGSQWATLAGTWKQRGCIGSGAYCSSVPLALIQRVA